MWCAGSGCTRVPIHACAGALANTGALPLGPGTRGGGGCGSGFYIHDSGRHVSAALVSNSREQTHMLHVCWHVLPCHGMGIHAA